MYNSLWHLFVSCLLFHLQITSSIADGLNGTEDKDFPDMSWYATSFLDSRVMKGSSNTVYTNTKFVVNRPPSPPLSSKDVSETDMYLLTAIEKLAIRYDTLEKRLRRTEELIFHIMEGSNIKRQDACPGNFTRVARNCYHFSDRQLNWKSASATCKNMGSNLLEIESRDEFMEVVTYLQATNSLRGFEFWTSGLNPGLLWIWANSARPIFSKNPSSRPDETVVGNGRCLALSLNKAKLYQYQGSDCAAGRRYICEHEENGTIRALARIEKSLLSEKETN